MNMKRMAALSHGILDLHLLPTEKCNFRCVYCYEDFKIGRMKPPVINGIKNLMLRRIQELKQLRISWFGGEPLLAANVVLDISKFARLLAEQHNCQFNFGMTTNGYLLQPPLFTELIEAGVNAFQISLDGTEGTHNHTRVRADGEGTFNQIWNNLVAMSETNHHFEVILRIHVTPSNHTTLPELLDKIKLTFAGDARFKVFMKAIADLGGPVAGRVDALGGKAKENIMQHLNQYLGDQVERHEISKKGESYICYASAQNAWVIRANGSLAKCTVAFDDDRNAIGEIHEDGSLTINHEKNQLWLRGLKAGDTQTMSCPLYKLPKLAWQTTT